MEWVNQSWALPTVRPTRPAQPTLTRSENTHSGECSETERCWIALEPPSSVVTTRWSRSAHIQKGPPFINVLVRNFFCLTSTAASRPIRDGDEWEKGNRKLKPRNRRQPGRPRLPWTAARTTKCYGSVRPASRSDHRTTQLLSQLLCRTESQRQCP